MIAGCCKKSKGPGNSLCQVNKCNKENSCYPLDIPIYYLNNLDSNRFIYVRVLHSPIPGHLLPWTGNMQEMHLHCNYCLGDIDNT